MIDAAQVRTALAEVIGDTVHHVRVYPAGLASVIALPAVVIGMPRWEANTDPCMDTWTYPVAVAVARPAPDHLVITQLEQLWPQVADQLRDALIRDQTLSGLCKAATLTRADPGFLSVQGQDVPAQTLTVEIYG